MSYNTIMFDSHSHTFSACSFLFVCGTKYTLSYLLELFFLFSLFSDIIPLRLEHTYLSKYFLLYIVSWHFILIICYNTSSLIPSSRHDALKHHFTSGKTYLIFLKQRVLERKFPWNWFTNTWQFSLIFKPHQIIFIHYKLRIATAIRGL